MTGSTNLEDLNLVEVSELLRRRLVSPVDLTKAAFARLDRLDQEAHIFLSVDRDGAMRAAELAEQRILTEGPRSQLDGIPISLKDNINVAGLPTTAGSLILRDHIPGTDSEIARRLRNAGAILLGKTNMHEFAYGITGENPHFGTVANPWDSERIAGGSSGGSAAAVANRIGYASVGTDTGGSIRIPAAMCGVAGLKPTYGLISMDGVIPLAKTFDHAGPLARQVPDLEVMMSVLSGHQPVDGRQRGRIIRIGWPMNFYFDLLTDEVRRLLAAAAEDLQRLGMQIVEISLPGLEESMEVATEMSMAEASAWHQAQRYTPEQKRVYGADVRERLEKGCEIPATRYVQGMDVRREIVERFDTAFEHVDAILTPSLPAGATVRGATEIAVAGRTEALRPAIMRLHRPSNFTGHPALTVPCGWTEDRLPIGLQLIGPRWSESSLLTIGAQYEQAMRWSAKRPPK